MISATRYAVFFAPAPESALWRFGSFVLGYDAATGRAGDQFVPASVVPQTWHTLTEEPRRYGFHATLKAPFRLAEGVAEAELIAALLSFCQMEAPFELTLELSRVNGFVALIPTEVPQVLRGLERRVVEVFERFRDAMNEAERTRRLGASLSQRQRELLDRYGYPYVLDEFRFHMTLSGRLPDERIVPVIRDLEIAFAESCLPTISVDRLALFREEGERFRIVEHASFASVG